MDKNKWIEEKMLLFDDKCMDGEFGTAIHVFTLKSFIHNLLHEAWDRGRDEVNKAEGNI